MKNDLRHLIAHYFAHNRSSQEQAQRNPSFCFFFLLKCTMNLFIADLKGTRTERAQQENHPSLTWHSKKAVPEKMTNVQTWESRTFL